MNERPSCRTFGCPRDVRRIKNSDIYVQTADVLWISIGRKSVTRDTVFNADSGNFIFFILKNPFFSLMIDDDNNYY